MVRIWAHISNLTGKREGEKGNLWKHKWFSGKITGSLGGWMGDRLVCGRAVGIWCQTSRLPEEKIRVAGGRAFMTLSLL